MKIKVSNLAIFFITILMSCSSESSKYTIDGTELSDFPEAEFLWNLPLNFKYGLPSAGPIVFKDKDGNYISRDDAKDYSDWCEYAYLLDEIETQWFIHIREKSQCNYPEILDFDVDYIEFHNAHPEIFQEYLSGLLEIQASLNQYLTGNKDEIPNKELADVIEQVYVRDHKYLNDFTTYELKSKNSKSHYAPSVEKSYKENPGYISNGVVIRFMAKKHEPRSIVNYVTFDGREVPEGTLWITREKNIKYTDD